MFGIGGIIGGIASSFLGSGGGGDILGKLFGGGGGLGSILSKLLCGGGQKGGQNNSPLGMLNDIHDMLSQLVDDMGKDGGSSCQGGGHGEGGGRSHGGGRGERPHHGDHGGSGHRCGDTRPMPDHGCSSRPEPRPESGCGGSGSADGCDAGGWDGNDKSPSMDREQGAYRLLQQAKNTSDPEQKQELVEMALEMLGESGSCQGKGPFDKVRQHMDGNSYDKDIVNQANKMMGRIGDSSLNDCNKGQAVDSVIDMLMNEGGVDGKPAGNDCDGGGRDNHHHRPMPGGLHHAHHHMLHR